MTLAPIRMTAIALSVVALGASSAAATPTTSPMPFPTVTVGGTAEIKVTPDQAFVTLGVRTFDRQLATASKGNDARTARVLAAIKASGVKGKDVTVDVMRAFETTRGFAKKRVRGFEVRRQFSLVVYDLKRLEGLLKKVLAAGATAIEGVRLSHTKLNGFKAKARLKAVAAARVKAGAMANALGQGIGKAIRIDEHGSSGRWATVSAPNYSNIVLNERSGSGGFGATVAAGTISITVTIGVHFVLN